MEETRLLVNFLNFATLKDANIFLDAAQEYTKTSKLPHSEIVQLNSRKLCVSFALEQDTLKISVEGLPKYQLNFLYEDACMLRNFLNSALPK